MYADIVTVFSMIKKTMPTAPNVTNYAHIGEGNVAVEPVVCVIMVTRNFLNEFILGCWKM